MFTPHDITVVIPTIAPRAAMLTRALASIAEQTIKPAGIVVRYDSIRRGAGHTRQAGTLQVDTALVAYADDDDRWKSNHLELLLDHINSTYADLVYPWFDVEGGTDPFPEFFGQPWDNEHPHQTTVTFLARTDAVLDCGGFLDDAEAGVDALGHTAGEEFRLVLRMVAAGYTIEHLPERSWIWTHWSHPDGTTGNTSGRPERVRS